ncbi:DUF3189 family protein [Biomaibacter acetigenes]|uniref:DUF3189 family protein n=1 Tax=Biomaibacter acetigenes TaxID=2316383 RepID=A0A3G2R4K1_9FIRM|nr:DUF3189 family protein [Biomaibacter acetigenes]
MGEAEERPQLIGGVVLKVIYSCYWGSYLAVVAASLHLGLLKGNDDLSNEKILNLPFFGKIKKRDLGEMTFIGTDNRGREIYVMGSKKSGRIIERTLNGFAQIYGLEKHTVDFIDLMKYNNFYTCCGTFMIHKLGLKNAGMAVLIWGIKKSFGRLRNLVSKVLNEPAYF